MFCILFQKIIEYITGIGCKSYLLHLNKISISPLFQGFTAMIFKFSLKKFMNYFLIDSKTYNTHSPQIDLRLWKHNPLSYLPHKETSMLKLDLHYLDCITANPDKYQARQ